MKNFFLKKLWLSLFLIPSLAQSLDNQRGRIKQLKVKSLSDLQQLTPYESISVIQKRYLPKTFRGELNLSILSIINHTFFYFGGFSARAGFFLREDHGFGLETLALLPPFFKGNGVDLIKKNILPVSLQVFSQLYGGLYYKWSPVFGKFSVLNRRIIYFDMYLTLGAGMTQIVSAEEIIKQKISQFGKESKSVDFQKPVRNFAPAMTVALGQTFALSQDFALNWELKWFVTLVQLQNGKSLQPIDASLFFGLNYYFPGASYR